MLTINEGEEVEATNGVRLVSERRSAELALYSISELKLSSGSSSMRIGGVPDREGGSLVVGMTSNRGSFLQ